MDEQESRHGRPRIRQRVKVITDPARYRRHRRKKWRRVLGKAALLAAALLVFCLVLWLMLHIVGRPRPTD